jgi:hypothetical protein
MNEAPELRNRPARERLLFEDDAVFAGRLGSLLSLPFQRRLQLKTDYGDRGRSDNRYCLCPYQGAAQWACHLVWIFGVSIDVGPIEGARAPCLVTFHTS